MWLYHWYSENKGWSPDVVDNLTLDQQFWLPVMKDAGNMANATLSNLSDD